MKKKGRITKKKIPKDKYNLGGRPVSFKSAIHLAETIEKYLDSLPEAVNIVEGGIIVTGNVPILARDFCVFAGISEQTLSNYRKKSKSYENVVDRLLLMSELYLEKRCATENGHKADFVLMNGYGWKNKSEQKTAGEVEFTIKNKIPSEIEEQINDVINKAKGNGESSPVIPNNSGKS